MIPSANLRSGLSTPVVLNRKCPDPSVNKVLLSNQQRTNSIHASRLSRLTSDARQRKTKARPGSAAAHNATIQPTIAQRSRQPNRPSIVQPTPETRQNPFSPTMSITKKSTLAPKTAIGPSAQKKPCTSSERKSLGPSIASANEKVKIVTAADDSIFEQPATPSEGEAAKTI